MTPQVDATTNSLRPHARILIGGARVAGPGYPNAEQTIRILQGLGARIEDDGAVLPPHLHLWRLATGSAVGKLAVLSRLMGLNGWSLIQILARTGRAKALVYVPYPSVFFLWLVSWLPRGWRPRCIADAYISIWDSLYRDRAAGKGAGGWLSNVVKAVEGRALRAAEFVLVDTEANKAAMVSDFALSPARVGAWPLAIDEGRFLGLQGRLADDAPVRVLFVGTLIPLHGIAMVLDAAERLKDDPRIEFRIVGDGQLGGLVEQFVQRGPGHRLTWRREWCSLDEVAAEIGRADICLGVFGGDGKASRVLPFKLYMYLASGKAVISQGHLSTPEGVPAPPIEGVGAGGGEALAVAIRRLAADPQLRRARGGQARAYYVDWLANDCLAERWARWLGAHVGGDGR